MSNEKLIGFMIFGRFGCNFTG